MSLINSVNTNSGAMIALESLNNTNSQLAAVQKQVDYKPDGFQHGISIGFDGR